MDLNPLQSAVYSAIRRFVQRQALVLEAMRDLRPDIVMSTRNEGDPDEWARLRQEYVRRPATGDWGKEREWEYFLHGLGCRLTHKVTHERIEWDAGDLHTFDRFWFVNHLEWLLDSDLADKDVSLIRDLLKVERDSLKESKSPFGPLADIVFPVLEELCESGILSHNGQIYYTLLTKEDGN